MTKHVEKIIPVLFRIWIHEANENEIGIIDIEYPLGDSFQDIAEAVIQIDQYGAYKLHSRDRSKDIRKDWYGDIESNLLTPLLLGSVKLSKQHLFGKGELHEITHNDAKFIEKKLMNIEIISPEEHARLQMK